MLKQLFNINTAIGVSLVIGRDGKEAVHACQITRHGQTLDIDKKVTGAASVKEAIEQFKDKHPVALNISGKGILIKQIPKIDEITANTFSQVLPNANFDDFYVQNFVTGDFSYVAAIRRAEADRWMDQVKAANTDIVMLGLGPFAADHILGQLNFYDKEIAFDGHTIHKDEQGNWTNYRFDATTGSPYPIKIGSEKIDEKLVLAYAAAFQLIMADKLDPIGVQHDTMIQSYQALLSKKWLKGYGAIAAVAIFILLLANFFILSWLNNENADLAYRVGRSAQNISDVKDLEQQVRIKEQKLKVLGWNGGMSKALITDQLASDLPDDMVWQSISIDPKDDKGSRDQKAMVFKDGMIRVTGLSPQIISVNEWMARVKAKRWVKAVSLESYSIDRELNTGVFIIQINY